MNAPSMANLLDQAYNSLRQVRAVADILVLATEANNDQPPLLDGTLFGIANTLLTVTEDNVKAIEAWYATETVHEEGSEEEGTLDEVEPDKLDELLAFQQSLATGRRVHDGMLVDAVKLQAAIQAEAEAGLRPPEDADKAEAIVSEMTHGA